MTCALCNDLGYVTSPLSQKAERCPCVGDKPVLLLQFVLGTAPNYRCFVCDPSNVAREALPPGSYLMMTRVALLADGSFGAWSDSARRKGRLPEQLALCNACVAGVGAFLQTGGRKTLMTRPAHFFEGAAPKLVLLMPK